MEQGAGLSGQHTVNGQACLLPRTEGKQAALSSCWEWQSEVSVGWRELFQGCLQSTGHNEPGSFH